MNRNYYPVSADVPGTSLLMLNNFIDNANHHKRAWNIITTSKMKTEVDKIGEHENRIKKN